MRSDAESSRYSVKVCGTDVAAIEYDNTGFGNQGHNMDIARFASNTITPQVEIRLKDGIDINSVTIHPVLFYPQEAIEVSSDKKTVRFTMDDRLPYAIVAVNGGDPQDAITNEYSSC